MTESLSERDSQEREERQKQTCSALLGGEGGGPEIQGLQAGQQGERCRDGGGAGWAEFGVHVGVAGQKGVIIRPVAIST